MGFGQSISTCLSKYATFSGRARRSEYWWFVLFYVILTIIAEILDSLFGTRIRFDHSTDTTYVYNVGWIQTVVWLAFLLPFISVQVRRLHDIGRSGWWWWLNIICCIGGIILFVFYLLDSQPGDNQYGPNPKGVAGLPPGTPPIAGGPAV